MNDGSNSSEVKIELTPRTISREIMLRMPRNDNLYSEIYMRFGGQDLESESDLSDFSRGLSHDPIDSSDNSPLSPKLLPVNQKINDEVDKDAIVGVQGTFFSLFKGFIAMGILFVPYGFKDGGYLICSIMSIISGIITYLGYSNLINIHIKFKEHFSKMGERALGSCGKYTIEICLIISQFGFSTAYVVYIVNSVREINKLFGWNLSPFQYTLYSGIFCAVIWIPMSWIRHIGKIASCHVIADIIMLLTFIYIEFVDIYFIVTKGISNEIKINKLNWPNLISFIGTSLYCYEAIGVVIPIYQQARNKQKFFPILQFTFVLITIIYTSFGLLGDLAFDSTLTNRPINYAIIDALSKENERLLLVITYILTYVYLCNLIPTYILMIYPALRIVEINFLDYMPQSTKRKWLKNLMRAFVVCLTILMGCLLQEKWMIAMSFIGSLTLAPLGFIFPGIFGLKLLSETWLEKIKDYFLVIFGIFVFIICTSVTIYSQFFTNL